MIKKFMKIILKFFIPFHLRQKIRNVLNLPEQINEIKQQNNSLSYELWKTKTLLLLREQSPGLLHKFASGMLDDNHLIDSLSQTVIFQELQRDFKANMDLFLQVFVRGAPGLDIKKTYANQLSLAKNPLYKSQVFSNMLTLFLPHYENEELAVVFDQMYDPSFIDDAPWYSIQYMLWLILRKEEERALDILKTYIKQHGLENFVTWIPIADLAHRHGFSNEDIAAASELFQTIINNVQNRMLENYVEQYGENPSIAIVGNGPQELGLGKGSEIDAHDIVVRFNSFDDSEIYVKDYGKKTNIVVFSSWLKPKPFFFDRKIDLFVTHGLYSEEYNREILLRYKERQINNITTIDLSPARREIQEKYNLGWSTTGFRGLYYFKEVLKKQIRKSDIYGFSLNTGKVIPGHYENPTDSNRIPLGNSLTEFRCHNFDLELKAMQDMFTEEG